VKTKKIQKEKKENVQHSLSLIQNYDESEDEEVRLANEVKAE
jgi:hypothetical protein